MSSNPNMLQLQADLADEYKYKPLSKELSSKYREIYYNNLPAGLKIDGSDIPIYASDGQLICSGYDRVVIGDYGAFIEFSKDQANLDAFIIEPGQEYRVYDPKYKYNVKYNWLTLSDFDIKIYEQKKTVTYADYKIGKYYISPHEDIVFGYEVNSKSETSGKITLNFQVIPAHCGECPLYMSNIFIDDEPSWGDGVSHYCPLGADYHGCLVERPKDCPIIVTKESNKNEKE